MDRERATQVRFEIDYWRALLDDALDLNDATKQAADDMAEASVALISLVSLSDQRANTFVRDGLDATHKALGHLMAMQDSLKNVLRLAEGRAHALQGEVRP